MAIVALLAGCAGGTVVGPSDPAEQPEPGARETPHVPPTNDGGPGYEPLPDLPSAAACGSTQLGRSYVGVLGFPREADRLDQAAGVERDVPIINTKWYFWQLAAPLVDMFGSTAHQDLDSPGTVGTFNGVRAARELRRLELGPLTAVKLFEIGFGRCLDAIAARTSYTQFDTDMFQSPPTAEGAREFALRNATIGWRRAPSEAELDLLVSLATERVQSDPVPERQWAYLCGAIVASAEFITR